MDYFKEDRMGSYEFIEISKEDAAKITAAIVEQLLPTEDDRAMAKSLVKACEEYAADGIDNNADIAMAEAENLICERINLSLDETEMGFTKFATEQVEQFVSKALGRTWTYGDAGLLGVDGCDR